MRSSKASIAARATVVVAITASCQCGVAHAVPVACAADEVTVFSCPSRGKLISVCASKGWSATSGYVQYRYGPRGNAEIVVPDRAYPSSPGAGVKVAQLPLSGGGVDYAAFNAGRYDYSVYSAVSGQWGLKSGVAIDKDGVRVGAQRCDRGKEGEFADGFVAGGGLPPAATTFVLPD
jgi:hypothetical protein